jgi:Tfp pilus assembly protein PilE
MRGLSLLDVLIIVAVVALLLFAATRDFSRYAGRTEVSTPPTATSPPGS